MYCNISVCIILNILFQKFLHFNIHIYFTCFIIFKSPAYYLLILFVVKHFQNIFKNFNSEFQVLSSPNLCHVSSLSSGQHCSNFALGRSLNISVLQFPHLQNGDNNSTCILGLNLNIYIEDKMRRALRTFLACGKH